MKNIFYINNALIKSFEAKINYLQKGKHPFKNYLGVLKNNKTVDSVKDSLTRCNIDSLEDLFVKGVDHIDRIVGDYSNNRQAVIDFLSNHQNFELYHKMIKNDDGNGKCINKLHFISLEPFDKKFKPDDENYLCYFIESKNYEDNLKNKII